MNVSYRWLRELAPTIGASAEEIAERLTFTAVPVDAVEWLGSGLEGLVVARVEKVSPHPKADRLVICRVDAGREEPVQVITGAPVVVEGGFYPFVGVGQTLPDGTLIKRAKLRGVYSDGMLCSERELGIGRDAAGIMQLRGEFTPGQPLVEALGLDDYRLELDVTANRPDLLGHWGVAREVAPGGESDLRLPGFPGGVTVEYETAGARDEAETAGVRVRIDDPDGCPRYMGAVIRGVTVGPSPEWLASRLRAVGLQPINNVVDATNYVLYELNQPLHAFDLARLEGPVVAVRRAAPGEQLRTLDGKDRTLDTDVLVIADARAPCALAGVMGGEASEVTERTSDVFLECAHFDPKRVRKAARRLGLDTDASYRFERGIDPEGLPRAMRRAIELILTVAGGRLDGRPVDVNARPFRRRCATLRPLRVTRLLGVELDGATIRDCLEPIGFALRPDGPDAISVEVPGWRPDVEREVDLIEEIARRFGYQKFPDDMGPFRPSTVPEDEYVPVSERLRRLMVALGFLEARSSPFVSAADGEIRLLNPLSEREDHLRRDLLTGLVRRVEYNFSRGERDVRLFELGTVFRASAGPAPEERIRAAAAWTGARSPAHWTAEPEDWDFWDLKSIAESVARVVAPGAEVRPVQPDDGAGDLEPPVLAIVTEDGRTLGRAGRVPAARLEAPPWAGPVWALEAEVAPVRPGPPVYRPLPSFPAVERDVSLLVPAGVLAAEIGAVIRDAAPGDLESFWVFDVYEGANLPAGTRSIAWRLRFRSPDRTLTDEEVDRAVARIISALEEKLHVRIRGA